MTESLEIRVRNILTRAGIDLSRHELREKVREFNNFEMPIGHRLIKIIESPGDFVRFLKDQQ